jgi:GrpE
VISTPVESSAIARWEGEGGAVLPLEAWTYTVGPTLNHRAIHEIAMNGRAPLRWRSFAEELLPPIDNLQRALASSIYTDSPLLLRGVETALRQLRQLLRQHGIESDQELPRSARPWGLESGTNRYDPTSDNDAILQMLKRNSTR